MMLANESVAERRGDQNALGESVAFVYGETVAIDEGLGIESLKKLGFRVLGVLPFHEGGR